MKKKGKKGGRERYEGEKGKKEKGRGKGGRKENKGGKEKKERKEEEKKEITRKELISLGKNQAVAPLGYPPIFPPFCVVRISISVCA